jgi:hypothetical protein
VTEITYVELFCKLSDASYSFAAHVEPTADGESFLSQTLQQLDDLPAMDQGKAVQLMETVLRYFGTIFILMQYWKLRACSKLCKICADKLNLSYQLFSLFT